MLRPNNSLREPASQLPAISLLFTTIGNSFKIFLKNFQILFSLFVLTTLPLSIFIFSLTFLSSPLKSELQFLEDLAVSTSIRFESLHVLDQARVVRHSLYRIKAFFFVLCYALSLFAAVATVSFTAVWSSGRKPTLLTSLAAVKNCWKRTIVTTVCIYVTMLAYSAVLNIVISLFTKPNVGIVIRALGLGIEVYVMAVMGLALVVTILEEQFGFHAIYIGADLMKGRRICGWVLSGISFLISGILCSEIEKSMKAWDSAGGRLNMWMTWLWENVIWLSCFGFVVLWSYVATTAFYCQSTKSSGAEEEENGTEMRSEYVA